MDLGRDRDINELQTQSGAIWPQQNHSLEDLVEERTHQLIQTNAEAVESKIAVKFNG